MQGLVGPAGPTGAAPTVSVGSITTSTNGSADVTGTPTESGVELNFTLPQGPAGETGATGGTGPAPEITVEEDTPTSYKVHFKTADQDIVSPNLRSTMDCHNVNLSAASSTVDIPVGRLVLTYQNTSTAAIRISVRAQDAAVPILADIRRASIYDSAVEGQTLNNTQISTRVVLDDTVYSNSQEMHWMRIRQRDPDTNLWSMCEVRTFASLGGARTSVCIEWFYTGAAFQTP
ncbi:collagen-like protein [Candidatus Soleaferrea massiliensis]|uniref:collagen-like protein n=1 Tax=Candidatus Soleaferrea massiliensis TaxID=1470354 RepID=UPI001FA6FB78|nr:collagen-like protein [Candidatus Soleaferrea massiliensis]